MHKLADAQKALGDSARIMVDSSEMQTTQPSQFGDTGIDQGFIANECPKRSALSLRALSRYPPLFAPQLNTQFQELPVAPPPAPARCNWVMGVQPKEVLTAQVLPESD
jgi:hypothetical protein